LCDARPLLWGPFNVARATGEGHTSRIGVSVFISELKMQQGYKLEVCVISNRDCQFSNSFTKNMHSNVEKKD